MRILIDECLPKRLKRQLPEHEVYTVQEMGWGSKQNGELLRLATPSFQVFLTNDTNLTYQQNTHTLSITIIALKSYSNSIHDLIPLMPRVRDAIEQMELEQIIRIDVRDQ